jgi:hypothetical protein
MLYEGTVFELFTQEISEQFHRKSGATTCRSGFVAIASWSWSEESIAAFRTLQSERNHWSLLVLGTFYNTIGDSRLDELCAFGLWGASETFKRVSENIATSSFEWMSVRWSRNPGLRWASSSTALLFIFGFMLADNHYIEHFYTFKSPNFTEAFGFAVLDPYSR